MEATENKKPVLNVDKILATPSEEIRKTFNDPEANVTFEDFLKFYVGIGGLSNRNYIKLMAHYEGKSQISYEEPLL